MSQDTDLRTESHDPAVPEAYAAFMRTGWGDRELELPRNAVAEHAAKRRADLAGRFPGERLVIPSGTYKARANDTDYRFRPETAHTWLSGNQTSDAVLVLEDGEAVLYARPRCSRESDEFFRDRQYGELWAGRRPSEREISASLDLSVLHVDRLPEVLGDGARTRVLRGVSADVDRMVETDQAQDGDLARVVSEMRALKDDWEVEQLQRACDVTTLGFEDCVREWSARLPPRARGRGGPVLRRARPMGHANREATLVGGRRPPPTR
ncbi:MAG: aminopeptidase P N-terminal domain-containing protein, partial [Nocardioides sp.]|nr:aminopeptidase P N-terminal domain-containing protein [Nocardioides sp.]